MKTFKIPADSSIPWNAEILEMHSRTGFNYFAVSDTSFVDPSWIPVDTTEWENITSANIEIPIIPDIAQLLGQFIVQQTLKNAELEQALNAIGAGIVQLQLAKGGA